ncbi:uncharacterized protein LOC130617079 [Hydractinia symbiolongicarpus]|uniref:uncharacterized protein LOC130617079 n=1 Tax=Hydractinia symbiolongicarpus TaxID=13093 RepID=UPI00254E3ADB|nr:uncharacterized protein LOC130617079 [Hydractinia symbiolongicarpus]
MQYTALFLLCSIIVFYLDIIDLFLDNVPSTSRDNNSYKTFLSLFDDEEEDECENGAMHQAIVNSLKDCLPEESASVILSKYISDNFNEKNEHPVTVTVNRQSVYKSTLRAIQRDTFSFVKPMDIHFSGELGVHEGGPRREFLRLLMTEIAQSQLFMRDWFAHDITCFQNKRYELAGKLTAWNILQGGPGLNILSVDLYYLMAGRTYDKCNIIQLIEPTTQHILMSLYTCDSEQQFCSFKEQCSDHIIQSWISCNLHG